MTHGSMSERLSVTLTTDEPTTPAAQVPLGRHYLLVFERGASCVFELPRAGEIVIGRGELADLQLREHAISRKHAVLAVADDRVVLRDLGSHNGTSVNGQRITAARELGSGDSVAVCAATLVLYTSAPAIARPAASTAPGEVTGAATALRTYRIGDRTVIVADPAMARLYALVERLARVDLPVLITGETGTGKELAATLLHERSPRRDKPLVALNCAAIQENLVESELFGYERGAFSGALTTKAGLLESAHGGTVFLDEIGDLPLAIQAKLLRVLETKRMTRLGDLREREINIRLVAATNCNLPDEVDAGRFRRDLFFRLSGAILVVPALRERTRELALLAELFLTEACRAVHRPAIALTADALAALHAHRWPGNVRELKNVMEYFAATLTGTRLDAAQLGERLGQPAPAAPLAPPTPGMPPGPHTFAPIGDEIRALETLRMTQALETADGNQTRAAELIGMPLRTFFTKMRQYGLRK